MTIETFVGPDLVDLSPRAVEEFLRLSGWRRREQREGVSALWENLEAKASLLLPLATDFRDFQPRFREALQVISAVHGYFGEALALEIEAARSDIMLLRAARGSKSGSIALDEARGLLEGAHTMLFAAACSAVRPRANNRGRRPDAAKDFMKQDVRMGHTLRGSFVLTILARHDETLDSGVDEQAELAPTTIPEMQVPKTVDVKTQADGVLAATEVDTVESISLDYSRRVMQTLESGLAATRELLQPRPELSIEEAVQQGVSLELVTAVQRVASFERLDGVDMSFRWSGDASAAPIRSEAIVFERPAPERVRRVTEVLTRKTTIVQDDVYGQVVQLERGSDDKAGVAVIDGVLGRDKRRVRVSLTGAAYRRAIRAHDRRRTVVAKGTVTLRKRQWWLEGEATVEEVS